MGAALLAAALAGSCSKAPAPPGVAPADLTFYWTCDAHGRLEPCGCFSGQNGGLTRINSLLHSGRLKRGLLADAGSAIAGASDYQVVQYRYLQQAFADMGYAALNIGEREAQLPLGELGKLRDTAPAGQTMISANLIDRATGRRIFPAYRIVESHGRHVAFVGALGDVPEENLGAGVAIEPARSALAKILPEIKRHADVIVLLAYADEAAMRALADEFYELDLILGGKVKEPSQVLTRQNRSVVLWTTNETKALGMVQARVSDEQRFSATDFNVYFIDEQIPQDPVLEQLVRDYRAEIRTAKLDVDDPTRARDDEVPGVKGVAAYVGSESCAACHATADRIWKQTGHARAFASLVTRHSDADPNCIGCHTIGFGTPTGYRREYAGNKLINVGCESCHGPGSEHIDDIRLARATGGSSLYRYRPLAAADCAACHYGEFSRPFNWDEFWPQIKHGQDPPPRNTPAAQPLSAAIAAAWPSGFQP